MRGLSWFAQNKKWAAHVFVGGRQHHIGYYDDTPEQIAQAAADIAAKRKALLESSNLSLFEPGTKLYMKIQLKRAIQNLEQELIAGEKLEKELTAAKNKALETTSASPPLQAEGNNGFQPISIEKCGRKKGTENKTYATGVTLDEQVKIWNDPIRAASYLQMELRNLKEMVPDDTPEFRKVRALIQNAVNMVESASLILEAGPRKEKALRQTHKDYEDEGNTDDGDELQLE